MPFANNKNKGIVFLMKFNTLCYFVVNINHCYSILNKTERLGVMKRKTFTT